MEPLESDKIIKSTNEGKTKTKKTDKEDLYDSDEDIVDPFAKKIDKSEIQTKDDLDPFNLKKIENMEISEKDKLDMKLNNEDGIIHLNGMQTLEKEVRVAMIGNVDSGKVKF